MLDQFTFSFHWYGLIVGLAVSLVWWLVTDLSQKYELPASLTQRWWLVMLSSLIGARAWHLLTDWSAYWPVISAAQWWQVLAVWQGGLSILGAILAAGIFIKWLSGRAWMKAFDVLVLALPFGQALGRVANWVNQELYGLPTTLPWGIKIDLNHRLPIFLSLDSSTKFHPLFAYEAAGLVMLGWLLWQFKRSFKNWAPGNIKLTMLYLTGYSWLRFGLDFLRPDRGLVWQGLGSNQWILLVVGGFGLGYWLYQLSWFQKLHQSIKKSKKASYIWPIFILIGLLVWLIEAGFSYQNQSQQQIRLSSSLGRVADQSEIFVKWQRPQFWGQKVIPPVPLKLTLAKTSQSRAKGLGGVDQLTNDGMLFWFDQPAKWQFWMKDMNFALDFVWLLNGEVVEITQNVLPPKLIENQPLLPVLVPNQDVNQVVELSSGRVRALGIKLGDKLVLEN